MIPHRKFTGFAYCLDDDLVGNGLNKVDHSAAFSAHCYLGYQMNGAWSHWWWGLAKPTDSDWALLAGADEVIDFWWTVTASLIANTTANTHFHLNNRTTNRSGGNVVDTDVATGQVYAVGDDWTAYPAFGALNGNSNIPQVNFADLPEQYVIYGCTYRGAAGPDDWDCQEYFFATGWNGRMEMLNVGDPAAGQQVKVELEFDEVRVRYHNPCVNSFDKYIVKTGGGETLVLTGLGFALDDAEVRNVANNPNNDLPAGGWDSWVTHIRIVNASTGAVVATLEEALGDFTRDSNSQITITAMPALAQGIYWLLLSKEGAQLNGIIAAGTNPAGYAGDWRTSSAGLMTAGDRLVLMAGMKPGDIVVVTDWTFNKSGTKIHRYYAPIDTFAPTTFYSGKILSISPITRGVSSGYGLFLGSDCSVVLSNADKEFSALRADHHIRNQPVKIYYAWMNAPHAWKKEAAILLGENSAIKGPDFKCQLRDVTTKYFTGKVPLYRCTADEFPNIQEQAVNRPKPEILGKHEYTETNNGGAIEAVYVDTVNFQYLAARGTLHDITEVYVDGVPADPAIWSWALDGTGQSIITFTVDQGDKRITFDAEGYEYADWDSANGYVQNPAYIMLFFLAFLAEVPDMYFDEDTFDDLATKFVTLAIDESGKLAIAKEEEMENVLKALLYTFGTYAAFNRQGKFFVDRKDYTSLATVRTIWAQIDMLDHPEKDFAEASAFNRMRARWDYVPAADVYKGGRPFESSVSIAVLEKEIESPVTPDFPYTDNAAWVEDRCQEDLCRWGYGSPVFTFDVPLEVYDQIELLDNVLLQDLYGVQVSGLGEVGHYAFIERMDVDLHGRKVTVYCADLEYLLTCVGSGTSGLWSHVF